MVVEACQRQKEVKSGVHVLRHSALLYNEEIKVTHAVNVNKLLHGV